MAANSSAHPARAGYNQSGGAYFVCVLPLCSPSGVGATAVTPATASPLVNDGTAPRTAADPTFLYKISTAAANSGGAFTAATLVPATALEVLGGAPWAAGTGSAVGTAAAEFAAGKLIKDMGKTIVSGGRTFRKFAVAATGSRYVDSRGVVGGAGYGTFYLDVGRDGATGTTIPAPIARYA